MRWWKVLGLAGVVGVAATGVATARAERHRRAYTPEEIRSTLRERVETSGATAPAERHRDRGRENATRHHHSTSFSDGR